LGDPEAQQYAESNSTAYPADFSDKFRVYIAGGKMVIGTRGIIAGFVPLILSIQEAAENYQHNGCYDN
jgi:hypothetical protein